MAWKIGVVTVSDKGACGEREDVSGELLSKLGANIGTVIERLIIPDEKELIEQTLIKLVDDAHCDLVLTTGGTGFAARDVTPEATKAVIEKEAPGLPEAMRAATVSKTKFAVLSRAVAGIRNSSLIVNFPGSPKAVRECFEAIEAVLSHALHVLSGDTEHI